MSRKLVCMADLHIHPWRLCSRDGGHDRLMDGLSVLRQGLNLARKLNAPWIFAGDMKQPKTSWPQSALTGAHAIFREYPDVEKVLVCGNHDAEGEGGCGLSPFSDVARVVEDTQVVHTNAANLVCVPWNGGVETAATALAGAAKNAKYGERILVAHGFLQGCMLGPEDVRIAKGTPVDAYGDFQLAVFGDVHKAQWRRPADPELGRPAEWLEMTDGVVSPIPKGSVFYCGSPMALNWGERNDAVKGALVIDLDDLVKAYMHPLEAPRYVHMELEQSDLNLLVRDPDALEVLNGNFVRVVYNGRPCDALDYLRDYGDACRSFQIITRRSEKSTKRAGVHAGMTTRELLSGYVEARPPAGVDGARAVEAGVRLVAEGAL